MVIHLCLKDVFYLLITQILALDKKLVDFVKPTVRIELKVLKRQQSRLNERNKDEGEGSKASRGNGSEARGV